MKSINFLALAAALTVGMASCTSETYNLNDIDSNGTKVFNYKPLRPSEINFYSNGIKLDNFYKTSRAIISTEGVVKSEECKTKLIDREKEAEFCDNKLPEKSSNFTEDMQTDVLFYAKDVDLEFEFYPVFSQTHTPNSLGVFYFDEKGEKHEVIVWENMDPYNLTETHQDEPVEDSWVDEPGHWSGQGGYYAQYGVLYSKGIKITIKKGYKFGFFWMGHNNTGETTYYSVPELNEEVFCTDGGGNHVENDITSKIHAVIFHANEKTYLGLEDWTDFDYQDWVFTCDKELTTVDSNDKLPGEPNDNPGDTDPGDDNPGNDDKPSNPGTPQIPNDPSVEVNFELNDEHENGDWIESHLSAHVRDTVDFEIFIPIKAEYYCEADDMMIVQKHDESFVYNKSTEEISMEIAGTTVTITVNYDENGITIRSHGINAAVLKECREKYGDGLTFEIRNYYNDILSREELKVMLSQATIKFFDKDGNVTYTGLYINSFGKETEDGDLTLTVTPDSEEYPDGWNEKKGDHENSYTPKSSQQE